MVFESSTKSLHAIELMPGGQSYQFMSFPLTEKTRKIFQPLLDVPGRPLETSRGDLVEAKIGPEVRVFEIVSGATLVGRAARGAHISAGIDIRNPLTGEEQRVGYATTVGLDGRFSIRVPYPTDRPMSAAPGTIEVKGPYTVVIDEKAISIEVSEDDIRSGRELTVPRN